MDITGMAQHGGDGLVRHARLVATHAALQLRAHGVHATGTSTMAIVWASAQVDIMAVAQHGGDGLVRHVRLVAMHAALRLRARGVHATGTSTTPIV